MGGEPTPKPGGAARRRTLRGSREVPLRRTAFATRRLLLRPYRAADYPAWRAAWRLRPPPATRWDQGPRPARTLGPAGFAAMVARHRAGAAADRLYVYAIFRRRDRALVGVLDLAVLVRGDRQLANLGYQVHPAHRGRGYAREAARAGLVIAFTRLGLHRVEAVMDPDHAASAAVAAGAGMVPRGLEPGYLFEAGRWVDQLVYAARPEDLGLPSRPPPRGRTSR